VAITHSHCNNICSRCPRSHVSQQGEGKKTDRNGVEAHKAIYRCVHICTVHHTVNSSYLHSLHMHETFSKQQVFINTAEQDECCLLGCYAEWLLLESTFRRGTCRLHHQGGKNQRARKNVNSNAVLSSLILSVLEMGATRSSETSALTRPTRRHITEEGILHSRRREDLRSYRAEQVCIQVLL
jgi:hypothetical protein